MTSGKLAERSQTEISVYSGKLTNECLVKNLKKIKVCFPQLDKSFYEILAERLRANNFSDDRLNDAVGFLLDNHVYKDISIASIVGYDRKIRLFTYSEILNDGTKIYPDKPGKNFDNYRKYKKIENGFLWVSITDVERYNLRILSNEETK